MGISVHSTARLGITAGLALALQGCAYAQAPGAKSGLLAACPDHRNCVNSDATDPRHAIAPLRLKVPAAEAWADLKHLLEAMPDVGIVRATPDYLSAEFSTGWFRFTDDVEFLLRAQQAEIAVRSASRVGYYDLGVNRERIEKLRAKLREKGMVE
ncbi:MAG: DUF1499 domain-containing protein [Betaproteobacteria bacterium]|nr:DUF1499 domain-containing protein [Betaproteobacteria bacterium]